MMRPLAMLAVMLSLTTTLSAASTDDPWPAASVNAVRATCHKQPRSDVPTAYLDAYCACWADLMRINVAWKDWTLVDWAIRTKGLQGLDDQEKAILKAVVFDGHYCFLKYVPQ